ncbi:MAG: hypothetical protein LAQ69_03950 [Acidobacteriia bacterium]|nr:hypothetical protein [Terriglobia bacterium]
MITTNALRKAMRDIAAKKGDFTLFALFKRANGIGKWDIVVSAPWLDGSLKTSRELVDLLAKSIGRKSLPQFARVETVLGHDPTVKFILKTFPIEDGERRIGSNDLFGLEMEDAIILRAKRPESKKPARKAPRLTAVGSARVQR